MLAETIGISLPTARIRHIKL